MVWDSQCESHYEIHSMKHTVNYREAFFVFSKYIPGIIYPNLMSESFAHRNNDGPVINAAFEELATHHAKDAVFLKSSSSTVTGCSSAFFLFKNEEQIVKLIHPDPNPLKAVFDVYARTEPRLEPMMIDSASTVSEQEKDEESCRKNDKLSLSSVDDSIFKKEFDVDIKELHLSASPLTKSFIALREDDLSSLYEAVYVSLQQEVNLGGYPIYYVKEGTKSGFVQILIDEVILFIRSKFHLTEDKIKIKRYKEEHFRVWLNNKLENVYAELAVAGLYTDEEKKGKKKKKYYLVVAELQIGYCWKALKQCTACMRSIFKLNRDQQTVFGICSTGTDYSFLCLDASGSFKLHEEMRLTFSTMFDSDESKSFWMKNRTLAIRILFTVLCDKLKISR